MLDGDTARLAASFADATRTLHDRDSTEQTLREIVAVATRTVRGAEHAGVTLLRRRNRCESRAVTGERARGAFLAQRDTGEGPSLDVMRGAPLVHAADLAAEERWPQFVVRARESGIASMLSVRLSGKGVPPGALNLYAGSAHAFDEVAVRMATVCAGHAAVGLSKAALVESLGAAVDSRQIIGEATGILMERHGVGSQEAFQILKRASQRSNVKLREVAALLVETRDLPAGGGKDRRAAAVGGSVRPVGEV